MSEPHIEHNYALPAALRKYARASSHPLLNYPQAAAVSGFQLEEKTHTDDSYRPGPLIWVGVDHSGEGEWLTNAEALALADALRAMAEAQTARLAKEGGAA